MPTLLVRFSIRSVEERRERRTLATFILSSRALLTIQLRLTCASQSNPSKDRQRQWVATGSDGDSRPASAAATSLGLGLRIDWNSAP
jgi:hypothetical protein